MARFLLYLILYILTLSLLSSFHFLRVSKALGVLRSTLSFSLSLVPLYALSFALHLSKFAALCLARPSAAFLLFLS